MDRLIEAIEDKQNPSVVGLDPTEATLCFRCNLYQ